MSRISDLRAADNILDLVVGLRPELGGNRGEYRRIDLVNGVEILLKVGQLDYPVLPDDSVDWKKVWRVRIMDISKVAG